VRRVSDLMEQGSNLVQFANDIRFENPANEDAYYYVVAKDFEWSFVDLYASIDKGDDKQFILDV